MVHFLAEIVESKYPEINGFENDLSHLHDASRGRLEKFQVKAIIHFFIYLSRLNHLFESLPFPRISRNFLLQRGDGGKKP